MKHPFDEILPEYDRIDAEDAAKPAEPTRRQVLKQSVIAGSAAVGLTVAGASAQDVTTQAIGEEGGKKPRLTTKRLGEEGGRPPGNASTAAVGEEGGVKPGKPIKPQTFSGELAMYYAALKSGDVLLANAAVARLRKHKDAPKQKAAIDNATKSFEAAMQKRIQMAKLDAKRGDLASAIYRLNQVRWADQAKQALADSAKLAAKLKKTKPSEYIFAAKEAEARQAYENATKLKNKPARIAALKKIVATYPKSKYAGRAQKDVVTLQKKQRTPPRRVTTLALGEEG